MTNYDGPNTLEYASPRARVSPMAQWSMILGIISIPTICVGVGPIIGVVAFILGSISGRAIAKHPQTWAGAGFAQAGRITGVLSAVLFVLGAIMMPPLGGRPVFANRSACAANITGFIKGFVVYANDYGDVYPTPGLPIADKAYSTTLGTVSTATDPDTALTQMSTTPGTQGNPMSALWMLVLRQQETPKSLICKDDPNASSTPSPLTDSKGRYLLNPANPNQISYSIAYPYANATTVGPWWKNTTLSDLPIMSDMAPLNATGKPTRNMVPTTAPSNVKTVNSGNHKGDGQNVGYADAHCEWRTTALAGQGGESIWTVGTTTPALPGYTGRVITGGSVPNDPPSPPAGASTGFDTIMVPVRDLGSGAIR